MKIDFYLSKDRAYSQTHAFHNVHIKEENQKNIGIYAVKIIPLILMKDI